ncbi:MAG: transglycosylase SLT domain-containing protein [Clostridia bacterium]|nr:transglycosylase SLT domain-containing protein [Clostridia bacterium]
MFKRIISLFIIMILFSTSIAFANTEKQEVTVYNKGIHINGEKIINAHSLYPYFEYKDIVYFPLTYQNSKILGFEVVWDEESQKLLITTQDSEQKNYDEQWIKQDWNKIAAEKSDVKLFINDKEYLSDDYPIMEYEYITYVPLTHKVIADYLKWDFFFNLYTGIYISTDEALSAASMFDEVSFNYYKALADHAMTLNKKLTEADAMRIIMLIKEKCQLYDMDELLIYATVWQESNFDPNTYYKGAIGLMQIMKSTGANAGLTAKMLYDPEINVDFGVRYLKDKMDRYDQQVVLALSAYNQGITRVDKGIYNIKYHDGVMSKKAKIEAYLKEQGITVTTDSSEENTIN